MKKLSKDKLYCLISVSIIFSSYIIQRLLHIFCDITREFAIAEAMIFSILTAVVYFLVTKSKEPFYGILTAIFGFRMMPPEIIELTEFSESAGLVYFIVQKFSIIIFAVAIIKLYNLQQKPRQIRPFPIILTIVSVPFCVEVYTQISERLYNITENMLYSYFSSYIVYSITMIVLLYCAVKINFQSAKLIMDYELVALALNIGRRICTVVIQFTQGEHISKNYFCWIAIYSFFFLAFLFIRKKKRQNKTA